MKLVIGNKKYSSWSFRPWLLLKQAGIPFREEMIRLHRADSYAKMRRFSPGGRVPALVDGSVTVWESLAICEYLAEKYPKKGLWPKDVRAKAAARSISNEMHAGFADLRRNLPCHFVARFEGFEVPAAAKPDIERVLEIWTGCRKKYGKTGPFLFGKFSVADAMFAPVVFRFLAYGVKVDAVSREYMRTIESLDASREWVEAGRREKETIEAYEYKGRRAE